MFYIIYSCLEKFRQSGRKVTFIAVLIDENTRALLKKVKLSLRFN
jgi:hypothetical protein